MPTYGRPDPFTQLRGQVIRSGAPFALALAVTNFVLFVVDYFSGSKLAFWLASLFAGSHVMHFWGMLTFCLVTPDYRSVLFACLTMWWIGGALERTWGTRRFAWFTAASAVVTSLCVWLGCAVLHDEFALIGLWFALSPIIIAWAATNPTQSILLSFVLPVPAWVLALVELGYVYFVYYQEHIALGVFGLLPCAAAFYYVRGNWSYATRGVPRRGPDLRMSRGAPAGSGRGSALDGSRAGGGPVGWLRAWQERRRLRKLWRDSGFGD